MVSEYVDIGGCVISSNSLKLSRSRELASLLASGRLDFVQFIECRRSTNERKEVFETVVFEVEIERSQRYKNDIKRVERIAAQFSSADNYPNVLALRKDFPKVPHLNLQIEELPRSLCLYEQSWSEISLRWTPAKFIERIRTWLTETAKGTLHQDDQPLEPVLIGNGFQVILPADLFQDWQNSHAKQLQIGRATPEDDCRVFLTHHDPNAGGVSMLAICIKTEPRQQTAICKHPQNIAELQNLLAQVNCDLRGELCQAFDEISKELCWNRKLLIIVAFPLLRSEQEQIEITDIWAFISYKSIADVGIAIGKWEKMPGECLLGEMLRNAPDADGSDIPIEVVAPHYELTRDFAANANASQPDNSKIIAIGVGAIGSQIIRLLVQSGFGTWTIIDDDWLAPHNIARHVLSPIWIGWPKAQALVQELTKIFPSDPPPAAFTENVILASLDNKEFVQAIHAADLILDMSASVPVARYLANGLDATARRCSIFMNPSGTDLVMLLEDGERTLPLDSIEMQYYREVAFNERLVDHLQPPTDRTRYSRSCRDISSTIPTTLVALHSAIAAQAIKTISHNTVAQAVIWRTSGSPVQLQPIIVSLSPDNRQKIGDWTLVVNDHVLNQLAKQRIDKLPNETGGVLIGSYDLSQKIIYTVDVLPSPPDSEEWPTLYIRGSKGLAKEVARVTKLSGEQLEYVGEWHSHPNRCSCNPSSDDRKVFEWLTVNMSDAGLPALMVIVGEKQLSWHLGKISKKWEITNVRK